MPYFIYILYVQKKIGHTSNVSEAFSDNARP
jgi:hypothetical protein